MNSFMSSDQMDFDNLSRTAGAINNNVQELGRNERMANSTMDKHFQDEHNMLASIRENVINVGGKLQNALAGVGRTLNDFYQANKEDYAVVKSGRDLALKTALAATGPLGMAITDAISKLNVNFSGLKDSLVSGIGGLGRGITNLFKSRDDSGMDARNIHSGPQLPEQLLGRQLRSTEQQNQLLSGISQQSVANTNRVVQAVEQIRNEICGLNDPRTGRQSSRQRQEMSARASGGMMPAMMGGGGGHSMGAAAGGGAAIGGLGQVLSEIRDIQQQQLEKQNEFYSSEDEDKSRAETIFDKISSIDSFLGKFSTKFGNLAVWSSFFRGRYTNDIPRSANPLNTLVNAALKIYEWNRIYGDVTHRQLNELIKMEGGSEQSLTGHKSRFKEFINKKFNTMQNMIHKAIFGDRSDPTWFGKMDSKMGGLLGKTVKGGLNVFGKMLRVTDDEDDRNQAEAYQEYRIAAKHLNLTDEQQEFGENLQYDSKKSEEFLSLLGKKFKNKRERDAAISNFLSQGVKEASSERLQNLQLLKQDVDLKAILQQANELKKAGDLKGAEKYLRDQETNIGELVEKYGLSSKEFTAYDKKSTALSRLSDKAYRYFGWNGQIPGGLSIDRDVLEKKDYSRLLEGEGDINFEDLYGGKLSEHIAELTESAGKEALSDKENTVANIVSQLELSQKGIPVRIVGFGRNKAQKPEETDYFQLYNQIGGEGDDTANGPPSGEVNYAKLTLEAIALLGLAYVGARGKTLFSKYAPGGVTNRLISITGSRNEEEEQKIIEKSRRQVAVEDAAIAAKKVLEEKKTSEANSSSVLNAAENTSGGDVSANEAAAMNNGGETLTGSKSPQFIANETLQQIAENTRTTAENSDADRLDKNKEKKLAKKSGDSDNPLVSLLNLGTGIGNTITTFLPKLAGIAAVAVGIWGAVKAIGKITDWWKNKEEQIKEEGGGYDPDNIAKSQATGGAGRDMSNVVLAGKAVAGAPGMLAAESSKLASKSAGLMKAAQHVQSVVPGANVSGLTTAAQKAADGAAGAARTGGAIQKALNVGGKVPGLGKVLKVGGKVLGAVGVAFQAKDAWDRFGKGDVSGGVIATVGTGASVVTMMSSAASAGPWGIAIGLAVGNALIINDTVKILSKKNKAAVQQRAIEALSDLRFTGDKDYVNNLQRILDSDDDEEDKIASVVRLYEKWVDNHDGLKDAAQTSAMMNRNKVFIKECGPSIVDACRQMESADFQGNKTYLKHSATLLIFKIWCEHIAQEIGMDTIKQRVEFWLKKYPDVGDIGDGTSFWGNFWLTSWAANSTSKRESLAEKGINVIDTPWGTNFAHLRELNKKGKISTFEYLILIFVFFESNADGILGKRAAKKARALKNLNKKISKTLSETAKTAKNNKAAKGLNSSLDKVLEESSKDKDGFGGGFSSVSGSGSVQGIAEKLDITDMDVHVAKDMLPSYSRQTESLVDKIQNFNSTDHQNEGAGTKKREEKLKDINEKIKNLEERKERRNLTVKENLTTEEKARLKELDEKYAKYGAHGYDLTNEEKETLKYLRKEKGIQEGLLKKSKESMFGATDGNMFDAYIPEEVKNRQSRRDRIKQLQDKKFRKRELSNGKEDLSPAEEEELRSLQRQEDNDQGDGVNTLDPITNARRIAEGKGFATAEDREHKITRTNANLQHQAEDAYNMEESNGSTIIEAITSRAFKGGPSVSTVYQNATELGTRGSYNRLASNTEIMSEGFNDLRGSMEGMEEYQKMMREAIIKNKGMLPVSVLKNPALEEFTKKQKEAEEAKEYSKYVDDKYDPAYDADLNRTYQERGMARSIDTLSEDNIKDIREQLESDSKILGVDYAQRKFAKSLGVNADKMFNALGIKRTKNSFLTDDEVTDTYEKEVLKDADFMASDVAKSILAMREDPELLNEIAAETSDPEKQQAMVMQAIMRRMIDARQNQRLDRGKKNITASSSKNNLTVVSGDGKRTHTITAVSDDYELSAQRQKGILEELNKSTDKDIETRKKMYEEQHQAFGVQYDETLRKTMGEKGYSLLMEKIGKKGDSRIGQDLSKEAEEARKDKGFISSRLYQDYLKAGYSENFTQRQKDSVLLAAYDTYKEREKTYVEELGVSVHPTLYDSIKSLKNLKDNPALVDDTGMSLYTRVMRDLRDVVNAYGPDALLGERTATDIAKGIADAKDTKSYTHNDYEEAAKQVKYEREKGLIPGHQTEDQRLKQLIHARKLNRYDTMFKEAEHSIGQETEQSAHAVYTHLHTVDKNTGVGKDMLQYVDIKDINGERRVRSEDDRKTALGIKAQKFINDEVDKSYEEHANSVAAAQKRRAEMNAARKAKRAEREAMRQSAVNAGPIKTAIDIGQPGISKTNGLGDASITMQAKTMAVSPDADNINNMQLAMELEGISWKEAKERFPKAFNEYIGLKDITLGNSPLQYGPETTKAFKDGDSVKYHQLAARECAAWIKLHEMHPFNNTILIRQVKTALRLHNDAAKIEATQDPTITQTANKVSKEYSGVLIGNEPVVGKLSKKQIGLISIAERMGNDVEQMYGPEIAKMYRGQTTTQTQTDLSEAGRASINGNASRAAFKAEQSKKNVEDITKSNSASSAAIVSSVNNSSSKIVKGGNTNNVTNVNVQNDPNQFMDNVVGTASGNVIK